MSPELAAYRAAQRELRLSRARLVRAERAVDRAKQNQEEKDAQWGAAVRAYNHALWEWRQSKGLPDHTRVMPR